MVLIISVVSLFKIELFEKRYTGFLPMDNNFLKKITNVIEDNISNEQFGVSELAGEIGMSRSNLLRKVKKQTGLSVSQFIRNVRLHKADEMLRGESFNVSEISYKVGFSSPSYFIRCFREYYGYPPGETVKNNLDNNIDLDVNQPGQSHQLCAIMFTDIEGYTALMQQDENMAVEFRSRHREVFNPITKKYRGKILQYYGDGTLSTFNSAIDAVRCGIELQQAFAEEPKIPVRIGIHSGDIIFTEDDIIGDGVNVASRIESLAPAFGICISDKVYDEVKNQSGIRTTSLGTFELKNVDKPMEVFAISNPGLVVPERDQVVGKLKREAVNNGKTSDSIIKRTGLKWLVVFLAIVIAGFLMWVSGIFDKSAHQSIANDISKKSIAVLPFINDSDDSSNVYIINGLMESTLNNLQKIKDLRVISRTSVEKYRNNPKSISEIAKELNVKYIIEGSGQKNGDQIMLTIQLINALDDKHIWSEQYTRQIEDIFMLQRDVAKKITTEIQAFITPEEEQRINKLPTENPVAYDFFLKGLDLLNKRTQAGLENSISYFWKAMEQDENFARAYSGVAIAYYFLDEHQLEKTYTDSINYYADKALFLDPQLPQGLIAKALFYMINHEYELAIPYFEKALEYKPNYDLVYTFLVDLYTNHYPNTEKYLEYALKGLEIDALAYDSATLSYSYLHISNAFIQSGFAKEALFYIDKSLSYLDNNIYSHYVRAYIMYAKEKDLHRLNERLLNTLKKDTNRLDVMQEVGKSFYYLRDFKNAYQYYQKFIELKTAYNLDIYNVENAKIGVVFAEVGFLEESNKIFETFKVYAENDKSIYKHINLATYYAYKNDKEKAIEHFKLFSQQDNYHYWIILFLDIDPLMDNVRDLPEYKKTNRDVETKFWENHKKIRRSLEEKRLI